ncbi:glycoside hydrolase family 3 C-terminal domain-containing protein [Arthrobacter sp. zg-ZUI100]|uniref:beta-glucosidase family protein n=1 Tax=Arthrobacter jiangjiafuii TaxID=2817475 RepID=UPI001AED70E6|nr:glycoside hydrolase family 3 C-terminal domain-containing protein [Arthrobacter jiangjiafuii]MBP3036233.1 glycoside hydrolase family 3 C-terminal domain-containing protein [Arthrobacter jiangjiafuii]
MEIPPFPDLPREENLPREEKLALLSGADMWRTAAVPGRGIRSLVLADGPHGLRRPTEESQPALGESAPATCFPAECATACSWDRSLLAELGTAVAHEACAQGVDVLLGPGLNIKRTPLCGRNFEYFSEDPLLAGELGAAWTAAVQAAGVGACPKHFAANNQEADRMRVDAVVDLRTLHEIYLQAFEIVVRKAQPWTVMAAYNSVNGLHATENPWLLDTVLRGTWGYDGVVVSDWGAVTDRAAALAAGLDLEMPFSNGLGARELGAGLEAGTLTEEQVDTSVSRILDLVHRADNGSRSTGQGTGPDAVDLAAHHELARRAAAASMVLLKNDGGILPLDAGGSIALVGELARRPRYQGSGSSQVNPVRLVSALTALQDAAAELVFEPGYVLGADSPCNPDDLLETAAAAAAAADTAVVFLGLPEEAESEGRDRTTLDLPAAQLALLAAVLDANPRTVVVLCNGGVVETGWAEAVPAVLEAWLPGQAGGSAVADVLFGLADPGGRLAETMVHRLQDTPAFGNYPGEGGTVRYGEGLLVGYRWYDTRGLDVAFPFGHGLSYTTFAYRDLAVRSAGTGSGQVVRVGLTVTNTGRRTGTEVVQLYTGAPEDDGGQQRPLRPLRELRGFEKLRLAPGESRRVEFELDVRALSRFDPQSNAWVADAGEYRVEVGASSRDIRLASAAVLDGTVPARALTTSSTIQEWLENPEAAGALVAALSGAGGTGTGGAGEAGAAGPADDGGTGGGLGGALALMGNLPLNRLARFPGTPVTEEVLETLEAGLRRPGGPSA